MNDGTSNALVDGMTILAIFGALANLALVVCGIQYILDAINCKLRRDASLEVYK